MRCDELQKQLYNKNKSKINKTVKWFDEFFEKLNIDIDGQEKYINNFQLQIDKLHKFPQKVSLDTKDLTSSDKNSFKFTKNKRFLFFYQSPIYNGDLKIDFSQKFIDQINERLKDIYVYIFCSVDGIRPAFEDEKNFIFKINHPDYKNIYFAIVKLAPKKYSFYYFYDMAGLLDSTSILEPFKEKVDILKNDLFKIRQIYSSKNINQALLLKEYQKLISAKNKDIQNLIKMKSNIFMVLDSIKADLQSLDEYMSSLVNIKKQVYKIEDMLQKEEIDFKDILKSLEDSLDNLAKIGKNQNQINHLTKEIEDKKQNFNTLAKKIDSTLQKDNLCYKDLRYFEDYIPDIIQLKNIEIRINDLKTIIDQESEKILGKVKLWLNSKKSELELEQKNYTKVLKEIINELPKIKENESNYLKEETKKIKWQINSLKEDIKSLKKLLDKDRNQILSNMTNIYRYLDEKFFTQEKSKKQEKEFLSKCYQDFLKSQNIQLGEDVTLPKLMRKIEIIYETGSFQIDELPLELQEIKERIEKNREYQNKSLKLSNIYDSIVLNMYDNIVEKLKSVEDQNSLFRQYIDTIQETLIDKIKIIY